MCCTFRGLVWEDKLLLKLQIVTIKVNLNKQKKANKALDKCTAKISLFSFFFHSFLFSFYGSFVMIEIRYFEFIRNIGKILWFENLEIRNFENSGIRKFKKSKIQR